MPTSPFRLVDELLQSMIGALLWLAVKLENIRRRVPLVVRTLRGALRRVADSWRLEVSAPAVGPRRAHAWNRTAPHVEAQLVRLHVEQPVLGTGQLRHLAARVLGFGGGRETVRRILIRNQHLLHRYRFGT